jgi:hypothetical protein
MSPMCGRTTINPHSKHEYCKKWLVNLNLFFPYCQSTIVSIAYRNYITETWILFISFMILLESAFDSAKLLQTSNFQILICDAGEMSYSLDHSDLKLMCLSINFFAFCTTFVVSGSSLIKSANSFSFSTRKQL